MQNENVNVNIMNRQVFKPNSIGGGAPITSKVMMEPGGIRAKRPSG